MTEEDCQDLLVAASAWTGAGRNDRGFGAESAHAAVLFRAGDLTVRAWRPTGRRSCQEPTKPVSGWMEPHVQDGCFAFLEVEG